MRLADVRLVVQARIDVYKHLTTTKSYPRTLTPTSKSVMPMQLDFDLQQVAHLVCCPSFLPSLAFKIFQLLLSNDRSSYRFLLYVFVHTHSFRLTENLLYYRMHVLTLIN